MPSEAESNGFQSDKQPAVRICDPTRHARESNMTRDQGMDEARQAGGEAQGEPYHIGDRIGGRYEIHRILGGEGKSGMGVVYVCYDHEWQEVFALKTFQDKYLLSKEAKDNFRKEALAWVHLERHPYILRALRVEKLDYRLFVASEFIAPDDQGRNTLTHHLGAPLSLKQALTWAIQFCRGMEYACSKGVTPHRDIKPDNILIAQDGTVKIADFGLTGLWDGAGPDEVIGASGGEDGHGLTFIKNALGKVIAGTPPWMAPEQFEGDTDVRSDIYSFGVVLYQMASGGSLPFAARSVADWRNAHGSAPVPALESVLFSLIRRCLAKDRAARYGGFGELREDLERLYRMEVTRKTGEEPPSPPKLTELEAWERGNKGVSLANLGLQDQAIREYREALRIKPDDAEAHYNLGIALADKGFPDEAIREYREALRIKPDNADAHTNLGAALADKGFPDEAIREYREALRIKPDYAEVHYNLGIALEAKGLVDEAIREYRDALRIKPDDAEAHYNLGNALEAKGLMDEAIREYRDALRIKPDNADAHYNLGAVFQGKGLLDEAIREYRDVLRIKPDDAEVHYNLGAVLQFQAKGLLDEVIREYREALRIKPDYAEVHYNLGNALEAKGLVDEAIREYRDALRINPDYAEARNNLGNVLADKGFPDEAIREYREVLRINPDHALAHINLGTALFHLGRIEDAVNALENFIRCATPEYDGQVEEVKDMIRQLKGQR